MLRRFELQPEDSISSATRQDEIGGFVKIVGDEISQLRVSVISITRPYQNRFHTRASSALNIALFVANEKRLSKIELVILSGPNDHVR